MLLAIIGVLATLAQLDRHAYDVPAYAKFVPSRFADFSLFREAVNKVGHGSSRQAVVVARRLVEKHPIPAESLTILALAEIQAKNEDLGSRALVFSAQRGWREPLAQKAVAVAASEADQWDVAADRLSALWRASPDDADVREFSEMLLAHPEVQTQFAKRLVGRDSWALGFLHWAAHNLPPESFVHIVESANRAGARFPCDVISAFAHELLARGLLQLEERLWKSQCGAGEISSKYDVSFSDPGRESAAIESPFAWHFPSAVGLTTTFQPSPRGVSLGFANTEPLRQLLARKYLGLAPGTYALAITAERLDSVSRPILAQLSCAGTSPGTTIGNVTVEVSNQPVSFKIPNVGCAVQELRLRVAKGTGDGILISIN
ncbi:hypothetical protein [Novosphingobium malaysiense]|uniref:hypothetical protein n=1 Tax=Novosphingobium malaysiense TaxID=1348853 RepID=UPI0012DFF426|nr:hypothetical protein [Novosphingobium malaysiense]